MTELGWNPGWDIQFCYIELNCSPQFLVLEHDNPLIYIFEGRFKRD